MPRITNIRTRCGLFVAGLALCATPRASAQLFEVTRVAGGPAPSVELASGAAYDPVHDCYFVVVASFGDPVIGRFIGRNGTPLGTVTLDARPAAYVARVAYSPDVSDGAGGFGGFVAIWSVQAPGLFARTVAFPAGPVGPIGMIRATQPGEIETKADIAYSPVDHVFLVGVGLLRDWANFSTANLPSRIIRLDPNVHPIDDTQLSFDPSFSCSNPEFQISCNEVEVEWNPISNEFGVLYNQGMEKTLARVSGGGTILGRTSLGISAVWGALAVNTTTGNYFAIGGGGEITNRTITDGAEISPGGALLASGLVTSILDTFSSNGSMMRLSYSTTSGTFLLVGKSVEGAARLLELNPHGVPVGNTLTLGMVPFVIEHHATAREWLMASSEGTNYIIGTLTQECLTPDPFVALGGGTCVNGGWFPPGITPPSPPSPVPGGCLTPDPFTALGGGTCVNGGWFPPGMTPPSPPSPVPGGCLTPDPFVALGGGTCVNGGWYPPGITLVSAAAGGTGGYLPKSTNVPNAVAVTMSGPLCSLSPDRRQRHGAACGAVAKFQVGPRS